MIVYVVSRHDDGEDNEPVGVRLSLDEAKKVVDCETKHDEWYWTGWHVHTTGANGNDLPHGVSLLTNSNPGTIVTIESFDTDEGASV